MRTIREARQIASANFNWPHFIRALLLALLVIELVQILLFAQYLSSFAAHSNFHGMAWEPAVAQVRATQGCAPRPIRLTRLPGLLFSIETRSDEAPFWSAACSRRGKNPLPLPAPVFARGEGGGSGAAERSAASLFT